MRNREYGTSGPSVVLLHGGPGAPGSMAPVARALSDSFRVLEPMQRKSGTQPLTVARHVEDLHDLLESRSALERPALVGHSWGAMLALAAAAAHPHRAGPLVLVGCGTFDRLSRARLQETREQRMDEALRRRLSSLPAEVPDPDERLRILGDLILPLDSYEPDVRDLDLEECDARAFRETWEDMLRLQEEGVYPASFAAIESPVLMLHGAADPHPGRMIHSSLMIHLPRIEYRELERCGHYPWLERGAREEFFLVLREWLAQQAT